MVGIALDSITELINWGSVRVDRSMAIGWCRRAILGSKVTSWAFSKGNGNKTGDGNECLEQKNMDIFVL